LTGFFDLSTFRETLYRSAVKLSLKLPRMITFRNSLVKALMFMYHLYVLLKMSIV